MASQWPPSLSVSSGGSKPLQFTRSPTAKNPGKAAFSILRRIEASAIMTTRTETQNPKFLSVSSGGSKPLQFRYPGETRWFCPLSVSSGGSKPLQFVIIQPDKCLDFWHFQYPQADRSLCNDETSAHLCAS